MQTEPSTGKSRPFRARNAHDIGVAIKHFRTHAGLTQAELAERTGILDLFRFVEGTVMHIEALSC